jgi:hypothetical protein
MKRQHVKIISLIIALASIVGRAWSATHQIFPADYDNAENLLHLRGADCTHVVKLEFANDEKGLAAFCGNGRGYYIVLNSNPLIVLDPHTGQEVHNKLLDRAQVLIQSLGHKCNDVVAFKKMDSVTSLVFCDGDTKRYLVSETGDHGKPMVGEVAKKPTAAVTR